MNKNSYYIYDEVSETELVIYTNSSLSYPLHNHSSIFSIGIILSGNIRLCKDGYSSVYTAGQTFIIPPYVPHALDSIGAASLLTICINKNKISEIDINKIINRIIFLYTKTFNFGSLSGAQLSLLAENLSYCKHFSTYKYMTPQIKKLQQILEFSPETAVNIEKMAKSAYMSKYHFIRKFKKETGLTPHQFQIQNKIRKAQRIFNNSENLAVLAIETGFFDQSHFIRYFKKIIGLTPSAYKKSFKIVSQIL
ncbi:MAG: AraC family transcriptional regulator [Fusobacteriales bacterium]|jgi:AraC-like DNA-binding protein/mannose-6-phosphate isomerase-like protein (cupin superfamily)|nr:AraC family transcriptional regulator [Fusobacteriales bacterium]